MKTRKSNYTTNFFNGEVTREDQFWALGWFFSDGNITKDLSGANIVVHSQDLEVLEKIRNTIQHYKLPKKQSDKDCYRLTICSATFAERLNELGCVPAKSLIIKYPQCVQTIDQHRWFLRGVFEGDGSIYGDIYDNDRSKSAKAEIASGSVDFLLAMQRHVKELTGVNSRIKNHKGKPARLFLGTTYIDTYKFMSFIYQTDRMDLIMKRKYDRWITFKTAVEGPPLKTRALEFYIQSPDGTIYHSYNAKRFSQHFGLNCNSIYFLVHGKRKQISGGWRHPKLEDINLAKASGALVEKYINNLEQ